MSCWHAHGPWCHGYPPPYPPPESYYPEYYPPPRRTRRRGRDADELADYLRDLEDELARVRRELAQLRGSDTSNP